MISRAKKNGLAALSLATFISGWFGCTTPNEPEFRNPLIPSDPVFIAPSVSLINAPAEGATVDTSCIQFSWEGNNEVMQFSYRMDDENWSQWTYAKETAYQYLDEGQHTFELKGRYAPEIAEKDTTGVSFIVDDLQGPALWFYPRHQEAIIEEDFSLEVMLKEVTDVMAVKAALVYDPAELQVMRIYVYQYGGSLLKSNGGTVIPFAEYDNTVGGATIEVATAAGNPPGVSGSGALAKVIFKAKAVGTCTIGLTNSSRLRNPNNVDIPIVESAGAILEVVY